MARDFGYIISPSQQRYTLISGKTVKDSFSFTNAFVTGAPAQQTFLLTVRYMYQKDGEPYIYDASPADLKNYQMADWITLDKKEITLKQNESMSIPFSIKVPATPEPGGKYAAIVITRKNEEASLESSGAKLADRIAFELLGNVAGTESRNSETTSFTVNKPIFWYWPNEKITFSLDFKNNGNVEYLPNGDIFVHQGDITKSIWNSQFNPQQLVILPGNTRSYDVAWQASGPLLKTDQNGVTINFDYFRIGQYTATAKVGNDVNGKRVISDRLVTFWILPLPLIVAILTVIVVSFLGIILWRRRQKHKQA